MERRTGSRTVVIATVWLYERKSPLKANLAVGNSIGHTTPACSSAQLRAESASSNNWLMIGLNGERTQASATEPKSSTTAAYPRGRPCMHWTQNSGLLQNRVMRHLHYLTNSSLLGPRSDRGRITTRGNGGRLGSIPGSRGGADGLFHLAKRCQQRGLRDVAHNGCDHPANSNRDVPAERHRLKFNVDPTISLFKPGDAVEPPDVAVTLARWKVPLIRPAIAANLLHTCGIANAVPTPRIELEIAGFVFAVECGFGDDLLVHNTHRVLIASSGGTERLGIDNSRLVEILVVVIITSCGQNIFKPGVGDEGRPNPVVDQAGRHRSRVSLTNRSHQNLSATNPMDAVRRFVNPEEGCVRAVTHLQVRRLDIRVPSSQSISFQLSPVGRDRRSEKHCAHHAKHQFAIRA